MRVRDDRRDYRTGTPQLDSDVATCVGYMQYGTGMFGQGYNDTICAHNYTLIEHNYLTYRKICPRMCDACDADLGLLAIETAEAAESALVVTIMLLFFCMMSCFLIRGSNLGQTILVRLDAYEGKTESLRQWNEIAGMTDEELRVQVARDRLRLDEVQMAEAEARDEQESQQRFANPMNAKEDDDSPMVVTGAHDKHGHYRDEDDDI